MQEVDLKIRDWEKFKKQACINLYRNNGERNLRYGALDSLSINELNYLINLELVDIVDEDFYRWHDSSSRGKWEKLKREIISNYFTSHTINKKKIYHNLYRANDRDIILTAINKRESFVMKEFATLENILTINVDPEGEKIYERFKIFENIYKF